MHETENKMKIIWKGPLRGKSLAIYPEKSTDLVRSICAVCPHFAATQRNSLLDVVLADLFIRETLGVWYKAES